MHLKDSKGKEILFLPKKVSKDWRIELFTQIAGPISTSDKIQFKKTDKNANRFANEKLTVTSVSKDAFSVIDAQGKTYKLTKELKDAHWDYSYSTTSYAIQSASKNIILDKQTEHLFAQEKIKNQRPSLIVNI